jgi:hypothetical protein
MDRRTNLPTCHGFTIEDMVELVRPGLATATAGRVGAGGEARGKTGLGAVSKRLSSKQLHARVMKRLRKMTN